jgi:lipopolysaccharide/colanic/teichoic acid biosynthesis glycosyltransferase
MTAPRRLVPGKRLFDVVVASVLFCVTLPVSSVAAVLVRLTSPGPVLFRASLVGWHGATFTMFKFRSMYVQEGQTSPTTAFNDSRVTPVGRVLRRYKIDELPQLLNVIRGDMSMVGPRPEVPQCVALYTEEERAILDVRPGLTDLASLEFVNLATVVGDEGTDGQSAYATYLDTVFAEKNRLRLRYVREASWSLDLKILARTPLSILGYGRGRTGD